MKRIAIGGWQHETNTFAPFSTSYEDFEMADGWPALTEGAPLFAAVAGINMPVEGFIQWARPHVELVPLLWTSAEPGGYVTDDAFERIAARMCDLVKHAGRVDGIYLDLHGAMTTSVYHDAEGEILRRIRAIVGPSVPIAASLDFHANISEQMVALADVLTVYRTYPHVDMAETGARAARLLLHLATGRRLFKAFRQAQYLVPLHLGATEFEPNRTLFERLRELAPQCASVDIALGFPPADVPDAGPSVIAYGETPDIAEQTATELGTLLGALEDHYNNDVWRPDDAIALAMANADARPVILADTQDNSGAGGAGDTMYAVMDLQRHGARGAVVALVTDPEFSAQAHEHGVGNTFEGVLGGKIASTGRASAASLQARYRVLGVGDGNFLCTGPVSLGARMSLGPMALVELESPRSQVRIVVSSVRSQPLDQAMLRHVGVEPRRQRILVLKSSVHFRADFEPLSARTLVVEWPGCNPLDPTRCLYKNLRTGVRLAPLGPEKR